MFEELGVREAQLSGDEKTQELLGKIAELQEDIIEKQQSGSFTLQDLKPLKDLQVQIQERKVFREYSDAYVQASAFLKEVNREISASLGFDFALFAASAGSGPGDEVEK